MSALEFPRLRKWSWMEEVTGEVEAATDFMLIGVDMVGRRKD